MKTTFAQLNRSTNLVEIVDIYTGEVIAKENPGVIYRTDIVYSEEVIDVICGLLVNGESLTKICKMPGMPSYNLFCKWKRIHPHINEQLDNARRDRAEFFRDKLLEEADAAESDDPINAHRLRVEAYKWAAGVDDGKYSPRAKIEATINHPTRIIVHTGINREPLTAQEREALNGIGTGTKNLLEVGGSEGAGGALGGKAALHEIHNDTITTAIESGLDMVGGDEHGTLTDGD